MSAHHGHDGPADAPTTQAASDLIGTSRLVFAGFDGVTDVVEGMHRNISGLAPLVGTSRAGPTRGITGLVYRNIRRVSTLVGWGLDTGLDRLSPLLPVQEPSPQREAARSVVNGVLGDYLVRSGNPLAIPTRFRSDGRPVDLERGALESRFPEPSSRLLILVHGLCMNDRQWQRQEHDHGVALAHDLGYTPLYLHYNSGLRVTENGRDFAGLLEDLVSQWPVPVEELVILGHSMGGLVSRSACRWGQEYGHHWPTRLKKIIFLGTPHHGATLERLGSGLDYLLGISPYSAPISRIGKIRSAGIRDLREGNIGDTAYDRNGAPERFLPGTQYYTVAATTQSSPVAFSTLERGDGLVPLKSALGQHRDNALCLPIPPERQAIFHGLNHFDLLNNRQVYERLLHWLGCSQ
ncbi:esterase/lipase family protein [Marinobacter sp. OP 3.4]|uniref:esterase/lipase family protein n=1 Tax=Marinobacter sp. OP 3.4 TaxID=3076501 RepID=UPI002E1B6D6C